MVVIVVAILLIGSVWFSTPKAFICSDCEQVESAPNKSFKL